MGKRRAFTLIEVLLAITVVAVFFGLIFAFYKNAINKSKYVEAVATVANISKIEEMVKIDTGEYVAAANTQEVNERLGMNIEPRWFNYKVIGVTNDNFIVLAERIRDDIESGNIAGEDIVVARNNSGPIAPSSVNQDGQDLGGGDPGAGTPPGSSSPGGGGPGGGSPGGGSPGGGSPGGGTPGGSQTGGGTEQHVYRDTVQVPSDVLALLNGTVNGDYFYDLINDNGINVVYFDFGRLFSDFEFFQPLAMWTGLTNQPYNDFYNGDDSILYGNTIYVNDLLKQSTLAFGPAYSDNAIATVITHEATHSDYSYNPDFWINDAIVNHGQAPEDIHITQDPFDSIDQEYNAFNNCALVWNEIGGTETNEELDIWKDMIGDEVAMKIEVRSRYGSLIDEDTGAYIEF
jgi:prepilin-type N-terminal cleavage/methylation domain-containing protein